MRINSRSFRISSPMASCSFSVNCLQKIQFPTRPSALSKPIRYSLLNSNFTTPLLASLLRSKHIFCSHDPNSHKMYGMNFAFNSQLITHVITSGVIPNNATVCAQLGQSSRFKPDFGQLLFCLFWRYKRYHFRNWTENSSTKQPFFSPTTLLFRNQRLRRIYSQPLMCQCFVDFWKKRTNLLPSDVLK